MTIFEELVSAGHHAVHETQETRWHISTWSSIRHTWWWKGILSFGKVQNTALRHVWGWLPIFLSLSLAWVLKKEYTRSLQLANPVFMHIF